MSKVLNREQLAELCTSLAAYLGVTKIKDEEMQERMSKLISVLALHFLENQDTDELLNIIANVCALDSRRNKDDGPIIVDNNNGLGIGVAFSVKDTIHIIGCKECFNVAIKITGDNDKTIKGDC